VYHLDLVIDPLNQKLAQSKRNTTIGMNPIATQNNAIVTLHLNGEERGSEGFAPYGELHGDDTFVLHWLDPMPFSVKVVFMSSLSSLPRFLNIEYDIRLMATPLLTSNLKISLPSM
jgi:hypothetical protein